ncbi:MAG: hypothetical protein R3C59_31045 [Planctomycetaceae bacterium]
MTTSTGLTSPAVPTNTINTTAPVEGEYRLREDLFRKRAADLRSTDRLFVRFRVIAFLAVVGTGCLCAADPEVAWGWILLPLSVFAVVLKLHQPIIKRLKKTEAAHAYYGRCLNRLAGHWRDFPLHGQQFADAHHPWSADLDVFGPGSLYQKLNQCRTLPAQRKLALWLTTVPSVEEIAERQSQAESLREQLDLRERLAMIDETVDWASAEKSLNGWLIERPDVFPRWALWVARTLGLVSLGVLILVFAGIIDAIWILLMLVLQAPLVLLNRNRIETVKRHVDSVDKALLQLSEVTQQFETFPFTEKSLQQLQNRLIADGVSASSRIQELSTRIQWLNNSLRNQFFIPLAWMFGLFLHLPHRIERWRACHGRQVTEWLDAVTTLEVVTSIAAFNYEKQHFAVPDICDDTIEFSAQQLGHPLLPAAECVRNDVSLTSGTPLMLISGSNMSGKSTLLRSVGTNLVLAYCGARVNATQLRAYPFQPGTAMRVSDSLQEGRSLFFSVVQRLKTVVDLAALERPVLFLLDEILSGTNSHDRRRGAEAVIRTLVNRGALGMVTTHDLTLTQIVDSMDGKAVNKHFEDQVQDGRMTFDYQLRNGVVQRSNAIELMRMMGLDV